MCSPIVFSVYYAPNSSANSASAITARMNVIAAETASRTTMIQVIRMLYLWGHSSGRTSASPGTPSGADQSPLWGK